MKHIFKQLFILLYLFFLIGCSNKPVISTPTNNSGITAVKYQPIKLKPNNYHKSCQFLFAQHKKPTTEKGIWRCLVETQHNRYPQLVAQFLSYKPALTKQQLGTILEFLTYQKEGIENPQLIKKLINAGAPTNNISLNNILILKAKVCDSVDLLIKNNLKYYKDAQRSLNQPHSQDLHMLTSINRGYKSCPNSIRLLARYNPKLLNVQAYGGVTPLQNYLNEVDHPEWDINIAKLLMTKNNIRLKDNNGYTPLHYIQLNASDNKAIYNGLIRHIERLLNSKIDKKALQNTVKHLIIKRRPKCNKLLNKTIQNQNQFFDCFSNGFGYEAETPHLVNKLLAYKKPAASKQTLSKIVATLATDLSNAIHTKSLKKLIDAGASTVDVNVPMIIYGGDFACDTLMLILKNNAKLYDDPHFLKSAPAGENNKYSRHDVDLHALSAVGIERGICPNAIQYLAKHHPHLRDVQERYRKVTPLHIYLSDTYWSDWDLETLEMLISKNNINMQDSYGNTPLHDLNNGAGTDGISEHEIRIIKLMIEKGADVTIKNKQGKSVKDLFESKNPKLKEIFSKSRKTKK